MRQGKLVECAVKVDPLEITRDHNRARVGRSGHGWYRPAKIRRRLAIVQNL
jgi:hypothetical protein